MWKVSNLWNSEPTFDCFHGYLQSVYHKKRINNKFFKWRGSVRRSLYRLVCLFRRNAGGTYHELLQHELVVSFTKFVQDTLPQWIIEAATLTNVISYEALLLKFGLIDSKKLSIGWRVNTEYNVMNINTVVITTGLDSRLYSLLGCISRFQQPSNSIVRSVS